MFLVPLIKSYFIRSNTTNSFLTDWFLILKLEASLEEAIRLGSPMLDLRSHGLEECGNILLPSKYAKKLKCLLLQFNLLREFSKDFFHSLESIQGLTLDYNKLEDIPFAFRHLKNLTVLNVSHNNFEGLHFFLVICQLKNLRILWANATGISEIPLEIAELTNLRTLGLRRNRITRLPAALFTLSSLRWLTLASNYISEIPSEISKLTSLVHLNLQRNFLKNLPETFNQLQELQYLFLDYNSLFVDSNFNSFIYSLPNLKYCSVSRNISALNISPSKQNSGNESGGHISRTSPVVIIGSSSTTLVLSPGMGYNDNSVIEDRSPSAVVNPCQDSSRQQQGHGAFSQERTVGESNKNQGVLRQSADNTDNASLVSDGTTGTETTGSTVFCISQDEDEDITDENEKITELSQNTADENHFGETLFTWDPSEGYNNDEQEITSPTVQGKNDDVTFGNVKSTSQLLSPVGEGTLLSVGASAANLNWEDHKNGNGNPYKRLPGRSSALTRTRLWILENQGREGVPTKLSENVTNFVDNVAQQAAINVIKRDNASAASSSSLVYIMPHGRELQTYSINASTTFLCNRTSSNTIIVTTSFNANNVQAYQPGTQSFESANDHRTVLESVSVNESFTDARSRNTVSQLEINDSESNYDPSDWEHSTPSSAIDDQDIVMRFAEFRDDETEAEDNDFIEALQDWKRIIPVSLIK